jgi:hypothetical protein
MPPKSKPRVVPDDQAALATAVCRLADLIEILTTSLDNLVTEIQWLNNERSQDYRDQHLPLTSLPRDPTTRDWHPQFGDGQRSPIL